MPAKISIEEVNALGYEEFIARFQSVVEHGMLIAGAAWSYHPFQDFRHLHKSFCDVMDSLPICGKQSILRCHPNLAGKLAQQGKVTVESQREQAGAGLLGLTDDQRQLMNERNDAYRNKFSFPFVICARENKVEAILNGLENRIKNTEEGEIHTGVEEVKKISYYRLLDLVQEGSSEISPPKL
ncbi:2-oxo-4-hydroxy-4-carboxy-5-ureidoimidazoline decarboxylase-like [Diadema antillarum]|uniref:2-oxo-4-hydroxy-4-carboxy-5-ureidoimidazoline decarboxylase-like n=1 Tax=Diadema antillarum TaxID=105358 RepID=UPI003A83B30C